MISGQNLPPRTSGNIFGLPGHADRPDRQKLCPSLHILPPNLCIFEAQNRQIFRTQLGGSFPGPTPSDAQRTNHFVVSAEFTRNDPQSNSNHTVDDTSFFRASRISVDTLDVVDNNKYEAEGSVELLQARC